MKARKIHYKQFHTEHLASTKNTLYANSYGTSCKHEKYILCWHRKNLLNVLENNYVFKIKHQMCCFVLPYFFCLDI